MKNHSIKLRRSLAVLMTVLMVMSAWVFVAPTKASAASNITVEPTSTGAYVYVYYSGSVSTIQAPTWTEYNGQDVCPWINMTSGSYTANGGSYNYRVEIKTSDFKNEGGLYHTHIYVNGSYYTAIDYYVSFPQPYSTEYYYPSGTKFVKNFQLTYDSSKSDAQSQCKPSGFSSGSTFPDSHNAVHDYAHNAAWVNQDLNEDAGGSYVYFGYTLTDDPTAANACKSVGIETSEWGNYKSDNSVSATVNGKTVTWWKANSGANSTYAPKLYSDGAVDLNKGAGGKDILLYATYDRNYGPAIDCVTAIDTSDGEALPPSIKEGNTYFNGSGWYSAIAINSPGSGRPDLNRSAGGDDITMYYHTSCEAVNSNTLRSEYAHKKWIYENGGDANSALVNALNTASSILADLADGYTTSNQTTIDNAVNALRNAIPTLTIDTDGTASLAAGKSVWYKYTPSSSGTFLFLTHASFDTKYELYTGTNTTSTTGQDDGDSTIINMLGMSSFQVYHEISLTSGTTYFFRVFAYDSSNSGSLPARVATPVNITFNATGGISKSYKLPKGYSSMSFNYSGVSRSGHTLLGWSTSGDGAQNSSVKLPSATITVPGSDTTYYALWNPNNPTVISPNSSGNAEIGAGGQVNFYSFTPSETRNYVFYATSPTDTFALQYDPQTWASNVTSAATSDDQGISELGQSSNQFRFEKEFTAGTTYLFGVKYYYTSATGTIPFALENIYTVSYDLNGATSPASIASQKKYYNRSITLSDASPTPVPNGYDFDGWAESSDALAGDYAAGGTFTKNEDTVLYAAWKPHTIHATLNKASGTGGTSDVYYRFEQPGYYSNTGCTSSLSSVAVPTRLGYTFQGYFSLQNGNGTQYIDRTGAFTSRNLYTQIGTNKAIPLYAYWTRDNYQITYADNTSGDYTAVDGAAAITLRVVPAADHHLKNSIEVKAGDTTLTQGTDYTFTFGKRESTVSILENKIGGALQVNVGVESCAGGTATCVAAATCATCGESYGTVDTVGGHNFTGTVRSDGNGANGTHSFLCVNGCGTYGGTVTHNWNSGTITTEPGCATTGVKTYTCQATGCGATYTQEVEATGAHEFTVPQYDDNNHWNKCANCDAKDGITAHTYTGAPTWGTWTADNKITATFKCDGCDHTITPEVTVISADTPAVCEHDGYTVYTASVMNNGTTYTTTTQIIHTGTALEHDWQFASFAWAEDNKTAKVNLVCSHDSSHTKQVDAEMSSAFTAATCEDDAYTVYTATYGTNTDSKTVTDAGTATGHEWKFASFAWAADNKTAKVNLVCGNEASHTKQVDAEMSSAFTAATCEDDAYTVYTATYGDQTDSKTVTDEGTATGHTYAFSEFVWAEDGKTAKAKYVCGKDANHVTYYDAAITPDVHAPECEAAGYTDYIASYDGHTDTNRIAGDPATGHAYAFDSFVWAEDGTTAQAKLVCANNGEHITYEAAQMSHEDHAATCETAPYTTYTATYGDQTDTNDVTTGAVPGHQYGDLVPATAASCTEDGNIAYYYCPVCEKYFNEAKEEVSSIVASSSGHSYGELHAAVSETCTSDGNIAYYQCSVCEKYFNEAKEEIETYVIPSPGHNYGTWIPAVETSCTAPGALGHFHCSVCGKDFDENHNEIADVVIAQLPHIFEGAIKDNGDGTHAFACTYNCGTYGNAAAHEFTEVAEDAFMIDEGNCTTPPTYVKSCVCGARSEETFSGSAPGHKFVAKEGKEPTCTEPGYAAYEECSVCGFIRGDQEFPIVDHNYVRDEAASGHVFDQSVQWDVYSCKFGCGRSYTLFTAYVRNDKGVALSGAKVRLTGNDMSEEGVTDTEGKVAFQSHFSDGSYELTVNYSGDQGTGSSYGKFNLNDGMGSGGFGTMTTTGAPVTEPDEETPTDQPTTDDSGNGGNTTPSAPRRCSWCDINEKWEDTPVIGWIVAFIHMIIHAVQAR